MDHYRLSQIDEELDSSEVEALCFLCLDVLNRKRIEGIENARQLFTGLEEKGLLENPHFLSQLLQTIQRADLVRFLEQETGQEEETDASPILSRYRVMLYKVFEDMTEKNLQKMKFLLTGTLSRRQIEKSNTALDVFSELEKGEFLSQTNVDHLYEILLQLDQQLALLVWNYKNESEQIPRANMNDQSVNNRIQPQQPSLSTTGMDHSSGEQIVCTDAQQIPKPFPPPDDTEFYALVHKPRGLCVIISNEIFKEDLKKRAGTEKDEESLECLFTKFGFTVIIHKDLTSVAMRGEVKKLGLRNFMNEDALVVCVLSHGEKGCVYGTDEKKVPVRELTQYFTSGNVPTLAGKPKLFFIQACQGNKYQKGALAGPLTVGQGEVRGYMEEDAGRVQEETVPYDADFLLGMATVDDCKSFRNIKTGSIYIQELCKQLQESAEKSQPDDILTVLTRVNREISKSSFTDCSYKQMPEPKYTLTKKLVLTYE